ncbi:TIGR02757 family protein [uncultured Prevotella sp.]|uniref:TIGR02757 family protein n=1 Tax=uncultured Prevotella sp. TaxID=159272 RepID=UPI0027E27B68|nr:TIGR02757 family protein [uncultured Prevotella sp.]
MQTELKQQIARLAAKYETTQFLPADPSSFMHRVHGAANQECMAFLASCLSYGSRKQFFPKIEFLLNSSHNEIHKWVRSGEWRNYIPNTTACYYRLYTCHDMHCLLEAYEDMLAQYGSMKEYIRLNAKTGIEAVAAICQFFAERGASKIIPKNTTSACKRVCMFLRWMVRGESVVDLGLWSDIIDRRTLIMPLDTHVVQEACRMGLLNSRTASMSTARRLTNAMLEIFPDDPLKGDFALFGLGVDDNAKP